MKLLIILSFISTVYCGINNSITVLGNNTIYLTHTNNCAIYKIEKLNNTTNNFTSSVVVGDKDGKIKGDIDMFSGLKSRLNNPRSIICSSNDTTLFFVDDDKFIKRVSISNNNTIKGIEIKTIVKEVPANITNIFSTTSYNYACSHSSSIIYFVSHDRISKINLLIDETNPAVAVIDSTDQLPSNHRFINISYYKNTLFYCYTTPSISYVFKKSNDFHNFDIEQDTTLIINNLNITTITGFTFTNNNLIITGSSNSINKLQTFDYYTTANIQSNNIQELDDKYSTLVDYKAIYGIDSDKYIIGRKSTDVTGFYKININNIANVTPISIHEIYSISVDSTNESDYNIDYNYLFNNKFNVDIALNDYRMIHFNEKSSNINLIKYEKAVFRTEKLNFNFNESLFDIAYTGIISNITIDRQNTLYIAEYRSSTSSIYYCINALARQSSNNLTLLKTTPVIEGKISSINYNHFNKSLHFITDKHYYKYKVLNETSSIIVGGKLSNLDNIQQTNDTDSLENINDFVIDTDYEIGYIAFETRLKWFYV